MRDFKRIQAKMVVLQVCAVLGGCSLFQGSSIQAGQASVRASRGSEGNSSTESSSSQSQDQNAPAQTASAAQPSAQPAPAAQPAQQPSAQAAEPAPASNALPPEPSEGFTGEFHRAHAGEIVFATRPVPRDAGADFTPAERVGLDDRIFLRPFMADSLNNALRAEGVDCHGDRKRMIEVRVNGSEDAHIIEGTATHEDNFSQWTTFSADSDGSIALTDGPLFFPSDRDSARFDFATEVVPELHAGENQLVFRVLAACHGRRTGGGWDIYRAEAARGELTVTVEDNGVDGYARRVGPFLERSSHRSDRQLQRSIGERVEADWQEEEFLGSAIISPRWNVRMHRVVNTPVSRSVEAAVVVRRRGADSCRVFLQSFTQQSEGRRYSRSLSMGTGISRPFPCANATRPRRRR